MSTVDSVLCPACNKNTISISRNKRRLCKTCADKNAYHSQSKKNPDNTANCRDKSFSYRGGCKGALPSMTTEQAVDVAKLIKSTPVHISLDLNEGVTELYAMVNNTDMARVQEAMKGADEENGVSVATQCRLTCHEQDEQCNTTSTINNSTVGTILEESVYPRMEASFGQFFEMDEDLAALLNSDFRFSPNLLRCVADLHAGCLINSNHLTAFIVTVEVYSKHSATDVHAESSGASCPYANCLYPGIFIGTINDSDGKKLKNKFIMASNTMNMLFTCSVIISNRNDVQIGPNSTIPPASLSSTTTRVFYRQSAVQQFQDKMSACNTNTVMAIPSFNICNQRQLISGFHHRSTYEFWRASAPGFQDQLHMPVTVFTLCDVPHFDGYGVGEKASATIASRFLQILSVAHHKKKGVILLTDFEDLLNTCQNILETKKGVKCWNAIRRAIEVIKSKTNHGKCATSLAQLCDENDFNALAQEAASKLSVANEKISKNVLARMNEMCS
ncbi:unnamed protein product [Absidia cylindrospora]